MLEAVVEIFQFLVFVSELLLLLLLLLVSVLLLGDLGVELLELEADSLLGGAGGGLAGGVASRSPARPLVPALAGVVQPLQGVGRLYGDVMATRRLHYQVLLSRDNGELAIRTSDLLIRHTAGAEGKCGKSRVLQF